MKYNLHSLIIAAILVILGLSANAQWVQTSLNNLTIYRLAVSGNNIFAGTYDTLPPNGVYLSSNNGSSWVQKLNLLDTAVGAIAIKGDSIFLGDVSCGVLYSVNNGNSWVYTGLTDSADVISLAIKGSNIIAGTDNLGVFFSSDDGVSWSRVNNGLPSLSGTYAVTFAFKGDTIFAGTTKGVFFTSNNGQLWTAANTGLTGYDLYVSTFVLKGDTIFAGTDGGVFLSSNNGGLWTAVNNGLTNKIVFSLAIKGDSIFAGTRDGVYLSSNNGNSWTAINTGLTDTIVMALAIKGDTLFAGTEFGGVWKIALSDITTGINEINNNENNISIFPNPATDNLTIQAPPPATIEITNIEGQVIEQHKTNCNTTNLVVSALAKGMYFVKAKTEKGLAVKKFIKE